MKVEKNKVVTVTYLLRENDENGTILEEVNEDDPLVFLYGHGDMISAFEKNLKDLKLNDSFVFILKPEEGYGEYREGKIRYIPTVNFMIDGKLNTEEVKVGNVLSLEYDQDRIYTGTIIKVEEDFVTMDFNHPLAGKILHFSGKIIDIRDASEEELSHGHAHENRRYRH